MERIALYTPVLFLYSFFGVCHTRLPFLTTWLNCSYWTEKLGIAQYLKKGTQIYLEGGIEASIYTSNSGQSQAQLKCRVTSIQLLGSKQESARTLPPSGHYSEVPAEHSGSDISPDDKLQF